MQIRLRLVDVAEFVGITEGFKSDINIHSINNSIVVDAKSIMSVMWLDFSNKLFVDINSNNEEEIERFNKEMERYVVNE